MKQAYDDFRELFPAAMYHAQIVPVDEVVTMILYHREDQMLRRLMLSEAESAELDRLWDELFYVFQTLLRVVSHEQLYEFATQDRKDMLPPLEKMRVPTRQRAEEFRARLKKTEPVHLAAVLGLAERAWRDRWRMRTAGAARCTRPCAVRICRMIAPSDWCSRGC